MMPLAGMLLGSAARPLVGKRSDFGIDDGFMRGSGRSIEPGHAAPFLFFNNTTVDKLPADLASCGGAVLRTLPGESKEKALDDTSRPILPTDARNSSASPATNNRSLLP